MHGGRGLVGERDRGIGEPGGRQSLQVLRAGQRAGDAPGIGPGGRPVGGRQMVLGDHVGNADPPAGYQDTEHLGEHGGLVGGQVDDAVGDHHVDGRVRQRDGLDLALEELHIGCPGFAGVSARQLEHLVGHVDAVHEPGRTDPPRRQQYVDAPARSQVKDSFALVQVGDRQRVSAAEAGQDRFPWQFVGLALAVQGRAEDAGRGTATALGRRYLQYRAGSGGVPGTDFFMQVAHDLSKG